MFILWESLVSRHVALGSFGAASVITNMILRPVAYHNKFFTHYLSVNYSYGVYHIY